MAGCMVLGLGIRASCTVTTCQCKGGLESQPQTPLNEKTESRVPSTQHELVWSWGWHPQPADYGSQSWDHSGAGPKALCSRLSENLKCSPAAHMFFKVLAPTDPGIGEPLPYLRSLHGQDTSSTLLHSSCEQCGKGSTMLGCRDPGSVDELPYYQHPENTRLQSHAGLHHAAVSLAIPGEPSNNPCRAAGTRLHDGAIPPYILYKVRWKAAKNVTYILFEYLWLVSHFVVPLSVWKCGRVTNSGTINRLIAS